MSERTEPRRTMSAASSVRSSTRRGIPSCRCVEWRERLVDAGWACPTWPRRVVRPRAVGAGADVVADELGRVGAPGTPAGVGMVLAAPTILEHGSATT